MESSVLVAPQLCAAAALASDSNPAGSHLDPDDTALYALNDFSREPPITIGPDRLIVDAMDDMKRLEVQALLVASGRAQQAHAITGLITAADITKRLNGGGADSLAVRDVMTTVGDLPLVHYESLESLTTLDVFTVFQGTGLTHLLVVEQGGADEPPIARGLMSRSSLGSRLHTPASHTLNA